MTTVKYNEMITTTTFVGDSVGEHLELVQPPRERKLDLACGQNRVDGFEGIDIAPGEKVDHVFNLLRFPWPFETSSITELHCSHFVEHIPMEFVDDEGNYIPCGTPGAKDLFFRFFDECHRILVPDGWMVVTVPNARSNRAFQDPTHRRFLVAESFFYLSAEWRKIQKLDHYNATCDFGVNGVPIIMKELELRAPEVQQREFNHYWNSILDWHMRLQAKKPGESPYPAPRAMPDLGTAKI